MSAALIPVKLVPVPRQERVAVVSPAFDAAFADFLRIDVANGDASPDTIRSYRAEVAMWVAWCAEQNFDPAVAAAMHIKRFRQALVEAGYKPITIRWKLTIVRRFYEAARNAGLRTDNPAAGVKSPRVRQATEDFNYLSDEELGILLAVIPDPRSEEHTSELQSRQYLVCRLLLETKKQHTDLLAHVRHDDSHSSADISTPRL